MCAVGTNYRQDTRRLKKPTATSEEPEQKQGVGIKSKVLGIPPAHNNTTKGWEDHLSHPPAQPLDLLLPSPCMRNQLC